MSNKSHSGLTFLLAVISVACFLVALIFTCLGGDLLIFAPSLLVMTFVGSLFLIVYINRYTFFVQTKKEDKKNVDEQIEKTLNDIHSQDDK